MRAQSVFSRRSKAQSSFQQFPYSKIFGDQFQFCIFDWPLAGVSYFISNSFYLWEGKGISIQEGRDTFIPYCFTGNRGVFSSKDFGQISWSDCSWEWEFFWDSIFNKAPISLRDWRTCILMIRNHCNLDFEGIKAYELE